MDEEPPEDWCGTGEIDRHKRCADGWIKDITPNAQHREDEFLFTEEGLPPRSERKPGDFGWEPVA